MSTDERRLVLNNVRRLMHGRVRNQPNWVLVMEVFAVGSTSAWRMCEEMGIDGDAMEARQAEAGGAHG